MEINTAKISIADLIEGYDDKEEDGVVGYGGKLDIRPPFQREFVYEPKQMEAVIQTIKKDFPLNVMYWAVKDDGNFEIIDGQQRTISICRYVTGKKRFSVDRLYYTNLPPNVKQQILNYKLHVYLCHGEADEKLEWFKVINTAGEKLKDQEMRNAVFHGSWVTSIKRYFSKTDGPAYNYKDANKYIDAVPKNQGYLEKALLWITHAEGYKHSKIDDDIRDYMGRHQVDENGDELRAYYEKVIDWVHSTFATYRREMKGIEWGILYNDHKDKKLDPAKLEKKISSLMKDEEVQKKKGIYTYVLSGEEKHLNLRTFPDNIKTEVYEEQKGICPVTEKYYPIKEMEADHIKPWSKGGKTVKENCQMLYKYANRSKSDK